MKKYIWIIYIVLLTLITYIGINIYKLDKDNKELRLLNNEYNNLTKEIK